MNLGPQLQCARNVTFCSNQCQFHFKSHSAGWRTISVTAGSFSVPGDWVPLLDGSLLPQQQWAREAGGGGRDCREGTSDPVKHSCQPPTSASSRPFPSVSDRHRVAAALAHSLWQDVN